MYCVWKAIDWFINGEMKPNKQAKNQNQTAKQLFSFLWQSIDLSIKK